ncbi:SusC/RagA family TonB-linked outer membrane protein [Niastella koreensis]|uniref:TonB-dependent receptor n=2 Tax=Niastella koreensis TaxID=354356 RepID=G8TM11_NIAKG|nr:TonB-dependent receptor [Niastella koreensis]AEV98771.1 TonB-dependent receptor [Niastella koreensis GR20-10]OQP43709.1 SusC/RagA family TonB-linked outer membrane protein [Niastella koreensis]
MKLTDCFPKTYLLLAFAICQLSLYAKDPVNKHHSATYTAFTVNGKVVDGKGNGLAGASIVQKEHSNATTTNANGDFSITIQEESAILVISYIGFQSKELAVKAGTANLVVQLSPGISSLEDVIVIGYGTQKKQLSTSAVATVKSEQLTTVPAANISNSLAGRATGVMTRANGGQPGSDNATIYVRGIATTGTTVNNITYNTTPLIVVDGIIRNNINEVDPNNIESVSVLKDAAAVAPYGLGGANGVLLITTKRGTTGAPVLSFGGYYGDQQPTYLPKMLGPIDYMKLKLEAYVTENPTGTSPTYSQAYIDSYLQNHAKDPDQYPISDALNDVVKKHAPIYQSNLQVRGGSQIVKYYAGLSYFKQDGMFDKASYERYNYNLNLDVNITPTTIATFSLNGALQKTSDVDGGTGQLFRGVYKFLPVAPLKFTNGLWGESSGNAPLVVTHSDGYFRQNTTNMLSTITLEQKLPFIKGLSIKGTFSYDPYNYVQKQWHKPFIYWTQNVSTTPYTYTSAFSTQESSATTYAWLNEQYWQNNTITFQGYLNYQQTFGKHGFTGLVVAESRNNKQGDFRARINNFAVNIDELTMGSSNKNDFDIAGGSGTGSQIGYVYRASYDYDRRFLLEASGRYDGHYYFAPGKRWVYLPAFSAGWIISNENFFKPVSFVDFLKIRGSWGKSGNLTSTGFQYLNLYPLRGNAYAFGDGSLVQGSYAQIENNPNITWEISKKTDVALEANLWKGLLRVEADYFFERRSGLLLSPNTAIPQEYGIPLAQENAGIMDNHGIELSIGTSKKLSNGLQLSIDGNFTYAKNKVIQLYETDVTRNNPRRSRTGKPYNTVFGYQSLGLFTTADDKNGDGFITAADGYNITQFGTLRPGDIKYADLGGPNGVPDGKIDLYDEKAIGRPQTPFIIYGINAAASWKGFDLSMLFQGSGMSSYNVYGFMTVAHFNNNSNSSYEYYNNRWTPDHQNAKYPRAYSAPTNNNGQTSDFWMVSSAYLRLKTASLGYTVPAKWSAKIRMKNFRLYVTGQNILTFSKLKFTDPETTGEQGYPIQKTILVGFNTSF